MPEAQNTAERVRAHGHEPVLAPLLTIIPCAYNTNVEGAQALIFTSSNGVRALPIVGANQARPVLTVGAATADAARAAGFTDVRSADGDVASLVALAESALNPNAGKLIHISGEHVAGNLNGELAAAGFTLERRIAYAAVAATVLPEAFNSPLDIVLFHSARAAETFTALGAPNATELAAACLSPAVADAARAAPWKRVIVASAPREDALLTAALSG